MNNEDDMLRIVLYATPLRYVYIKLLLLAYYKSLSSSAIMEACWIHMANMMQHKK